MSNFYSLFLVFANIFVDENGAIDFFLFHDPYQICFADVIQSVPTMMMSNCYESSESLGQDLIFFEPYNLIFSIYYFCNEYFTKSSLKKMSRIRYLTSLGYEMLVIFFHII